MALSNFNGYVEENTVNFEGLNMLSTVFSVLFAIFNCYLASMVIYDYRVKAVCTMLVFGLVQYTIIQTNFIFGDITYHTTISLIISIGYTCVMIPAFGWISQKINDETIFEAKLSYQQRDGYRRMFDGLQEGIIVVDDMNKIGFMNELSNKVLSELANLKNFFRNKDLSGEVMATNQLDLNLFFLFENDKSDGKNVKVSKKKKIGSQSDHSKHSTDQSNVKTEFCIRDIIHM